MHPICHPEGGSYVCLMPLEIEVCPVAECEPVLQHNQDGNTPEIRSAVEGKTHTVGNCCTLNSKLKTGALHRSYCLSVGSFGAHAQEYLCRKRTAAAGCKTRLPLKPAVHTYKVAGRSFLVMPGRTSFISGSFFFCLAPCSNNGLSLAVYFCCMHEIHSFQVSSCITSIGLPEQIFQPVGVRAQWSSHACADDEATAQTALGLFRSALPRGVWRVCPKAEAQTDTNTNPQLWVWGWFFRCTSAIGVLHFLCSPSGSRADANEQIARNGLYPLPCFRLPM